jgi:hypothetical protein
MKYCKLRIAWSVVWSIVAVLLLALWVRSYSTDDYLEHFNSSMDGMVLGSIRGVVYLSHTVDIANGVTPRWERGSYPVNYNVPRPWLFAGKLSPVDLAAPHFLFVGICLIIAAASWLPRRFTLRTLLIATTLVAAVLGFITWLR